jgi:large-conductance mechanosensitive channel
MQVQNVSNNSANHKKKMRLENFVQELVNFVLVAKIE